MIKTNLKIHNKVRILKENDSGKWGEVGKGVIFGFAYNQAHEPNFAKVRTFQEGELTDYEQLLPIDAPRMKLVKW